MLAELQERALWQRDVADAVALAAADVQEPTASIHVDGLEVEEVLTQVRGGEELEGLLKVFA